MDDVKHTQECLLAIEFVTFWYTFVIVGKENEIQNAKNIPMCSCVCWCRFVGHG